MKTQATAFSGRYAADDCAGRPLLCHMRLCRRENGGNRVILRKLQRVPRISVPDRRRGSV